MTYQLEHDQLMDLLYRTFEDGARMGTNLTIDDLNTQGYIHTRNVKLQRRLLEIGLVKEGTGFD
jgi:hypothetical protein